MEKLPSNDYRDLWSSQQNGVGSGAGEIAIRHPVSGDADQPEQESIKSIQNRNMECTIPERETEGVDWRDIEV